MEQTTENKITISKKSRNVFIAVFLSLILSGLGQIYNGHGHKHLIYKSKYPYDPTMSNSENIIVPADSYYLLGDNRDIALDSRHQGSIHKDKIKEKSYIVIGGRQQIELI
jgi:ribosome biogenesis SPOUT family RNA methylase Rps3